jgi:trehalose/maltose hydrolase-like predicted phosphorylase
MSGHLNSFVYTVCLKGVDYMTKTKSIILCLVILIAIFSGCSTQETNSKSEVQANTINAITNEITAEQETSESETTTQKSDNSETTVANKTKPAEQKSAGQNTTKKVTTTQKQTTTKRQTTTKKVTTIQKPTTHKVTTTKKPTTTKGAPTKHTHTMPCGNVGKWYSSKDAFMSDYYAEADYWNNKLDNDEISYEEYISKVPRGHEVWQCSCGKWTGNYKYK